MGRKTFLSVFGWVRRKENKWWGPNVFSPGPPKSSLQNEDKTEGRKWGYLIDKNAHVQFISFFFFPLFFYFSGGHVASFPFFFLFFFFSFLHVAFFFFFFFSVFSLFDFQGYGWAHCLFLFSFFFFFLFFLGCCLFSFSFLTRHDFYFLINWVIASSSSSSSSSFFLVTFLY